MAVVVMILLTASVVLVLEPGGRPAAREQQAAKLSDETGDATGPEREVA